MSFENINLDYFYDPYYFAKNFQDAYGIACTSDQFAIVNKGQITAHVLMNLTYGKGIITADNSNDFALLTCILFAVCFGIVLAPCACVPSTILDLLAYAHGIGKNCYVSTCTSNSFAYYTTSCPASVNAFIANMTNIFANNITINIQLGQSIVTLQNPVVNTDTSSTTVSNVGIAF